MSGVGKIEIHETSDRLSAGLDEAAEKLSMHEPVHALYLLKSKEADSITHAARLLGRNRVTVQR